MAALKNCMMYAIFATWRCLTLHNNIYLLNCIQYVVYSSGHVYVYL